MFQLFNKVMPDLLVNLLKLPSLEPVMLEMNNANITIRRAQPFEITQTLEFVEREFSIGWADEISVGFANKPVSVYVAVADKEIVGFAGYECTRRSFFGPTGVAERMRGRSIGKSLLLASLWGLREMGYVYGIIGGVGPVEFYEKTVGAIVIPDGEPGIYSNLLK
jgi:GNAT superfamily N-acetyltransferase